MRIEDQEMIKVGLFGATGYTGFELVKIIERHPQAEIWFATSQSHTGCKLNELHPAGPGIQLISPDGAPLSEVDVVFLCLPHGAAAPIAIKAMEQGTRVVDLSADFRLKDAAIYEQWYGVEHPAPQLLPEAVYGLTEFVRDQLPEARLVANPGCYPTSILLALQPLLEASAVSGTIIADSKSGVSGAGRVPKQHTHFVEVSDNFSPYNIGRTHRHLPEIEQGLGFWNGHKASGDAFGVVFSPHLLPVPRGILSTIYVPLKPGWSQIALRSVYDETYGQEPFVQILPVGALSTLAHANHTNQCVIALTMAGDMLILTSAIDNLIKGAAGQSVQNMNLMFGIEETAGLL
jgi:N-acetyl-gamma-glutamyl-phosphate reductase